MTLLTRTSKSVSTISAVLLLTAACVFFFVFWAIVSQTVFFRPIPESNYESTGSGLFVSQSSAKLECSEKLRAAFCTSGFNVMWEAACQEHANATSTKAVGAVASQAPKTIFQTNVGQVQTKQENPATDLWPYYKLWLEHHWRKRAKEDVKVKNSLVLRDRIEISRRECSKMICCFFCEMCWVFGIKPTA